MTFGHEQLDVYRTAIEYVGWAFRLCERLRRKRQFISTFRHTGRRPIITPVKMNGGKEWNPVRRSGNIGGDRYAPLKTAG